MQIVGYDRTGGDRPPALVLADGGAVSRRELTPGTELAYGLGERHCAGVRDGDEHVACDAASAPYCDFHTEAWPCARCTGNCHKPLDSCEETHAIYLAAFAPDVVKVGVTREWRLDQRLREQGADRAAHLRTVADGRIARQIEAEIAEEIPDRVRVPDKVRGFAGTVDDAVWERHLAEFEPTETFDFDYGLDLDRAPIPETTASGTVRGVKGRVLVLEGEGTTYAVDMRDLVGHDLRSDAGGGDRQSSLGAFS